MSPFCRQGLSSASGRLAPAAQTPCSLWELRRWGAWGLGQGTGRASAVHDSWLLVHPEPVTLVLGAAALGPLGPVVLCPAPRLLGLAAARRGRGACQVSVGSGRSPPGRPPARPQLPPAPGARLLVLHLEGAPGRNGEAPLPEWCRGSGVWARGGPRLILLKEEMRGRPVLPSEATPNPRRQGTYPESRPPTSQCTWCLLGEELRARQSWALMSVHSPCPRQLAVGPVFPFLLGLPTQGARGTLVAFGFLLCLLLSIKFPTHTYL